MRIHVEKFRGITNLDLRLFVDEDNTPRAVISGAPAVGKTTLLDAIALAAGRSSLMRWSQTPDEWEYMPALFDKDGGRIMDHLRVVYLTDARHHTTLERTSYIGRLYAKATADKRARLLEFLTPFFSYPPHSENVLRMLRAELDKPSDDLVSARFARFGSCASALLILGGALAFLDEPPHLVLIDEPEQHLPPMLQRVLLRQLQTLAPASQLIVTSNAEKILESALHAETIYLAHDNDPAVLARAALPVEDAK